jgi:hypothetical protein
MLWPVFNTKGTCVASFILRKGSPIVVWLLLAWLAFIIPSGLLWAVTPTLPGEQDLIRERQEHLLKTNFSAVRPSLRQGQQKRLC